MPRVAKDNSRYHTMSDEELKSALQKSLEGAQHMLETATEEVKNGGFDTGYVSALTRMVRANTLRADVIGKELSSRS